jgi:protein SSD1
MSEDAEDGRANGYEEGEVVETPFQLGHQPRAQSQSYTAPWFAALAQQQQQEMNELGPSGRPQLAPNFMFGARRRGSANPSSLGPAISEEDANFQFPQQQQSNFDIAAPTEHRRTTSTAGGEITGIMAEQIAIQSQIEALQQQQQVLYQQQLASNQLMGSQFAPLVAGRVGAHRRVQSTLPVGLGGAFGGAMGQFGAQLPAVGLDQQNGQPRGHGRRHSVNVVNKSTGHNASISYPATYAQDTYDDGFVQAPPMAAHSRQASRADSSWRMSTSFNCS